MDLTEKRCVPCEGGMPAFTDEDEDRYLAEVSNWNLDRTGTHKIRKDFSFPDFAQALAFANAVGEIAEAEGHHPNISFTWGTATIEIWTHAAKGLTENDFILAAKIDRL